MMVMNNSGQGGGSRTKGLHHAAFYNLFHCLYDVRTVWVC